MERRTGLKVRFKYGFYYEFLGPFYHSFFNSWYTTRLEVAIERAATLAKLNGKYTIHYIPSKTKISGIIGFV
jgi:hypothetical protein